MNLDTSKVEFSRSDIGKNLLVPQYLDELLAEEIGIFIGDGHLSKYSNHFELGFTGNSIDDRQYLLQHVNPLMKKLFGRYGTIIERKTQNTIEIKFWSKALFTFHSEVLRLPIGKKKFLLEMPSFIINSPKNIVLSCVRGLMDTDGT